MKAKVLTPFSEIKEIEVGTLAEVEMLEDQGYTILETKKTLPRFKLQFAKISPNFLAEIFRDLAGFLSVGISLNQAIDELIRTTTNKKERKILETIREKMAQGYYLYQIFSDLGFPEEVILSVKAGEKGSILQKTFQHLSWYYEQIVQFQGKLKTAFIYPAFVLTLTFAIATGISVFVVPKIKEFLLAIPDLPRITQIFFSLTGLLARLWWLFPCVVIGIIVLVKGILTSERASKFIFTLWNAKLFSFIKQRIFAYFFLELYMLLENGISLQEALDIIDMNNKFFQQVIDRVKNSLSEGFSFSQALSKESIFPAFIIQTVARGEGSGNLTEYVKKISDFYWRQIQARQKELGELIGQILIVFIAVGVGGFVAIFLYSIYGGVFPKLVGGITSGAIK